LILGSEKLVFLQHLVALPIGFGQLLDQTVLAEKLRCSARLARQKCDVSH
jgi:hypothetical protein